MDGQYCPHIPIHLPRGDGRTSLGHAWARQVALAGAKSFVIADREFPDASEFRDGLRELDHDLFERVRLNAVAPRRDEFRLRGTRWDAAVCENIDAWPMVAGEEGPISVLMEEILTYTHGPVLCTYADCRGLAKRMFGGGRHSMTATLLPRPITAPNSVGTSGANGSGSTGAPS